MVTSIPPPGWQVPWRSIVVAALPRSGSSLLCEHMRLSGVLGRPDEYFSEWVMPDRYPEAPRSFSAWAEIASSAGRSGNGVFATKLFPDHFERMQKEIRFSEWFGPPRWIWLRRLDLVGQAISFTMAQQTRAFRASSAPVTEARYDGALVAHHLQLLSRQDAQWAAYFARTRIEPLQLIYEDIETDMLGTLQRVADLAGVRLNDPPLAENVTLKKQRNRMNEEWRERFCLEFGQPDNLIIPSQPPSQAASQSPAARGLRRWVDTVRRRLGTAR